MKSVPSPGPTKWTAPSGALLLVSFTLASTWIARASPASRATVLASASVLAVGTLCMALVLGRWSRYPRWAWYGTALLLALFMVLSAALAEPRAWIEHTRSVSWMYPWLLLVTSVVMPAPRGCCAPTAPWGGWLLLGAGTVLGLATVGGVLF
jgi:hypothetical protein